MNDEAKDILTDFKFQQDHHYDSDPVINHYTATSNDVHLDLIIPKKGKKLNF